MNFLTKIRNSIYDPQFYLYIKNESLKGNLRYFFSLIGWITLILAFVLIVKVLPFFSRESLSSLAGLYPKGLSLEMKNGEVSSNVTEPYFIKYPKSASSEKDFENFAVIDTHNKFSLDLLKSYKTFFWIGKDFVVTLKNKNDFDFKDIGKSPNFSLTEEKVRNLANNISDTRVLIGLIIFVVIFSAFMSIYTFNLLFFILLSLIVWGLFRILKRNYSFAESFAVIVYASTLPLILDGLFIVLGLRSIPLLFSALTILIVCLNLVSGAQRNTEEKPQI